MKNSFFLVVPKQQKNSKRLAEFETRSIQHWISELPAGNPGLATRLLHDLIIESNTLEMPGDFRLDMLERILPSALAIEDDLQYRLVKSGFPKEENDHKILRVLVSIEKEFAIAYWTVLKELTQKQVGWLQSKSVGLALQRCLQHLSGIVMSHYIMGMPVPDWVWIDLHSLYRLSVKLNLNTKPAPINPCQPNEKSSPEQCYKQILLLSLTDPSGLMQREIPLVYRFIDSIATLVALQPNRVQGQSVQCLILTDEDKPPMFVSDKRIDHDFSHLYIDFSRLIKSLDDNVTLVNQADGRFCSMHVSQNADQPAADLLTYLKQRWSGLELQSSTLFGDRLDRYIAIGLAAAYALHEPPENPNDYPVEYLCESKSENLLSCQFEQPGILSVGSLITFRTAGKKDAPRLLGVVNKVVVNRQSPKIHFAIQLLTASFHPAFYALPPSAKTDDLQKALLFSGMENGEERNYLITDRFLLKENDIVRLQWKNEEFPIVLHDRKNIGLGYWQFRCVKILEKNKPVATKKGYDFI